MKEYWYSRATKEDRNKIDQIYNWCVANFGHWSVREKYIWYGGPLYGNSTHAVFRFYDDEAATVFILRWT